METMIKNTGLNNQKNKFSAVPVQLCSFRLAERLFGVNIKDVKEISSNIAITPIFHAHSFIDGYMNIRGQIHLVVNLRKAYGFESRPIDEYTRVIIFKNTVDEAFGIIVDSVADVIDTTEDMIVDRRESEDDSGLDNAIREKRRSLRTLTVGVCRLENKLMVVLNAFGILDAVEEKK